MTHIPIPASERKYSFSIDNLKKHFASVFEVDEKQVAISEKWNYEGYRDEKCFGGIDVTIKDAK